jgi:hypothetical protein
MSAQSGIYLLSFEGGAASGRSKLNDDLIL